jgi:hypothetical protein
MTPERLAEIKEQHLRYALMVHRGEWVDAAILSIERDLGELVGEVERLQAWLALGTGVIGGLERRAWRLTQALEQIVRQTERGAQHEWAPQQAIHQIAKEALAVDPQAQAGP